MKELNYFLSLESELIDSFNVIEPCPQNTECFGSKYTTLLYSSCIEFESNCKTLIKHKDSTLTVGHIGQIKEHLLTSYPNITTNIVHLGRLGLEIKPLENWKIGDPKKLQWWDAYTDLKHNRVKHFEKATMLNVLNAMASLFITIVYIERIVNNKQIIRQPEMFYMEALPKIRVSQGRALPDS